jgi:hypothetical protein
VSDIFSILRIYATPLAYFEYVIVEAGREGALNGD